MTHADTAPLDCQHACFDIPSDVLYLAAASKSALLKSAVEAGQIGAAAKAHPWTVLEPPRVAQADDIRERFARLIGASGEDIAIQPSVAYGIATAAQNLKAAPGSRILVIEGQFPSNVYAWKTLAAQSGAELFTVPWPDDNDWTRAVLGAIDERVSIAALPPCHWTDGAKLDLVAIGARLKDVGAAFVVDATQWAGAAPIDVNEIGADFLVVATYKWLLGPYGLSFMYAAPKHHNGTPLEDHLYNHGGPASITNSVTYPDAFTAGARRFDAGQFLNLVTLPMIQASLVQIEAWQPARIAAYLSGVTGALVSACEAMGLSVTAADVRSPHIVGVRRDGGFPSDVAERLAAHNVYVNSRGGAIRLSPYLFNAPGDAVRFTNALGSVLTTATR